MTCSHLEEASSEGMWVVKLVKPLWALWSTKSSVSQEVWGEFTLGVIGGEIERSPVVSVHVASCQV